MLEQDREDGVAEEGAPCHPLVVVAAVVAVRTVELAPRKGPLEPEEEGLVADMHAERDLRLSPVAAEVALADEDADE